MDIGRRAIGNVTLLDGHDVSTPIIGDALCSFNPVYGQGMTSAALQAAVLQRCLSDDATGDLGERYFRSVARRLQPIWRSNRLNDFAILPAHGWRAAGPRRQLVHGEVVGGRPPPTS